MNKLFPIVNEVIVHIESVCAHETNEQDPEKGTDERVSREPLGHPQRTTSTPQSDYRNGVTLQLTRVMIAIVSLVS